MNILWEMYQQGRIASVEANAEQKAVDTASTVQHFQNRIDRLVLITMAMWSLLKEKTNMTDDDLIERIKQIDLSDGVLDGKVRQEVVRCPQCGRIMSNKHKSCLYCGFMKEGKDAFDAVT